MSRFVTISLIAGIFILIMLTPTMVHASDIYDVTDWLIPQFEGFRAAPYWDVSRYSWGYGTPAPGPNGTITPEKALQDMRAVVQSNYNTLHPLISRELSANQWGALMSFAYNEGPGNAENLVSDINAGDDGVLETHWKKYIYANHVVDSDLVSRRDAEWDVWIS